MDYNEQAKQFLRDTGTTFEIVEAVPQKAPLWTKGESKHGINYSVTLKNKRHAYTFDFWGSVADMEKIELAKEAKERGIYSSQYFDIKDWCEKQATQTVPNLIKGRKQSISSEYMQKAWLKNVVDTVKILITPTAYDVLACLDVLHEDNFSDFCASYRYDDDSIHALKTYEACKDQDYQLRKLFSHDELEKLSEIN